MSAGHQERQIVVLIADDAPDVARRLAEVVRERALARVVGPAANGLEALEIFRAEKPDAALLDVNMPHLDGIGVLRAIRASGRACFVIMMTSQSEGAIRERCLSEGADHFVSKAFVMDDVVRLLSAARRR